MASQPQTLAGLNSGLYTGLTKLKIPSDISTFPPTILTLAPTLEILDLSGNTALSALPAAINQLTHLKVLFLSDCAFTTFPDVSSCPALEMVAFKNNGMREIPEAHLPPQLRWLILTNNVIRALPQDIGRCTRLEKCMLAGNELTTLPDSMVHCRNLALLRLSCNKFHALPSWVFRMPRLAFLAVAGNPCCSAAALAEGSAADKDAMILPAQDAKLEDIAWQDLEVQDLLGEGASGIISKAVLHKKSGASTETLGINVAVKVFKGAVTSDGSPMEEMAACIAAGKHEHLISPLGRITAHPKHKHGLVLELIPPTYTILGQPPTLSSCTRDSYPNGSAISVQKGLCILRGVVAAARHLHSRGISHGDLYAHNILVNGHGHALLGDFGAASVYAGGPLAGYAPELEKLEVLAFAHLLEDIIGLVDWTGAGDLGFWKSELLTYHARCSVEDPAERMDFVELQEQLDRRRDVVASS